MAEPDPNPNPGGKSLLNPWQRRVVAGALTVLGLAVLLAGITGLFFLLRGFVLHFSGVIWPLAMAGILALILRPVVQLFEGPMRLGRIGGIGALYLCGVIVILGILFLMVPVVFRQVLHLIEILPEILRNAYAAMDDRYPEVTRFFADQISPEKLDHYAEEMGNSLREFSAFALPAAQRIGDWLATLATFAAGVAIIPVYLFFFLLSDRDPTRDLDSQVSFIPKRYREDLIFLIREFARILVAFFRGQIIIALIMGILIATGFTIIGLDFGIVLGLTIGALNIIPYLGTIIGLAICLPVAYLQPDGGMGLLGLTLGVFTVVQLIESYGLTPRIMGSRTGLHPLAVIIAIFFWGTALGGILGMVLAIPLTAFFVVAWRLLRRKYLTAQSR